MPVSRPENSSKKYWIIGGVIAVLVIGGFWLYNRSQTVNPPEQAGINSLTVSDQDADAVAVLIDNATLTASGFVAIHSDASGQPGTIVANSRPLTAGGHSNLTIIMPLTPGATYWAMLHGDDGNGVFDANNDKPLTDETGAVVMKQFKVKLTTAGESKG